MRFYRAKEKQQERDYLRESYLMRGVQLIVEYTGGFVRGKQGLAKWEDVVSSMYRKQGNRSGDEIATDVLNRLGLTGGDGKLD